MRPIPNRRACASVSLVVLATASVWASTWRTQDVTKASVGPDAQVNGTAISNLQYEFTWSGCDRIWVPCKSYTAKSKYLVLPFRSGVSLYFVPFDRIAEFASGTLVLRDGTRLPGSLAGTGEDDSFGGGVYGGGHFSIFEGSNRMLTGTTSLGEIEFPMAKISSFSVKASDDRRTTVTGDNFQSLSKLSATIVPSEGSPIDVQALDMFSVDSDGYRYKKTNQLSLIIGGATLRVELSKVASLQSFRVVRKEHGLLDAVNVSVKTKDGQSVDAAFSEADRLFFGGVVPYGYLKIAASSIKSIELR